VSRRAPKRKGPAGDLAGAVEAFLDALGLPREVRAAPDLAGTPRRVAEAWTEDLLDGYRQDPAAILADSMPATSRALVAVTGIDFHSMCPHHLLPSRGVAHVAYVPGERVVGFGQIARLVDALAHRLVLEEDLARDVAEALVREVGARGAACVLDAEQFCLSVRGERRREARAHAQVFLGVLEDDPRMQDRFLGLVRTARAGAGPASGSRSRPRARSRSRSRSRP
jgi:GTP cyclohydrolase I